MLLNEIKHNLLISVIIDFFNKLPTFFASDNDAHGNSAFHPDGGPGGIVHTGEGGFELQTSLLSDKGIHYSFCKGPS